MRVRVQARGRVEHTRKEAAALVVLGNADLLPHRAQRVRVLREAALALLLQRLELCEARLELREHRLGERGGAAGIDGGGGVDGLGDGVVLAAHGLVEVTQGGVDAGGALRVVFTNLDAQPPHLAKAALELALALHLHRHARALSHGPSCAAMRDRVT